MNRTSFSRRSLKATAVATIVLILATSTVTAAPSPSDVASARSLVMEGRTLLDKGDVAAARDKFRAAYALVPTPIIGLDLARAHAALGELIEAREVCSDVARLPVLPKESSEGKKARSDCANLSAILLPRIATLTIVVKPAAADVAVDVDTHPLPSEAIGSAHKVNPGSHTVRVRRGAWEETRVIEFADGAVKIVKFSIPPSPAMKKTDGSSGIAERPTPPAPPSDTPGTVAKIGLGVGAVLIGVGGYLGWSARNKYVSARDEHCDAGGCDAEGKTLTEDARARGNAGSVVFGVGAAVAVISGVVWLALPAPEKTAPRATLGVGPTSITFSGSF